MPNELSVRCAKVRGGRVCPGLERQRLSGWGNEAVIRYKFVDTLKPLPGRGVQIAIDAYLSCGAAVAACGALVNVDTCASGASARIARQTLACVR